MAGLPKAQLREELAMMARRTSPILNEYLDGYLLIGRRSGTETAMHVFKSDSTCTREEVESMVLLYAAEILEQRKRAARPRKKR